MTGRWGPAKTTPQSSGDVRELDPAAIERLRTVLNPRRERHSFALAMQRWAELARGRDPGASERIEQPGVDQFEWPAEPPGAEGRYLGMLITDGPATRNRPRKRKARAGRDGENRELRALFEEAQRKHRAKAAAPIKSVRTRKRAGSRVGAPRADLRREALLFLAVIYREFAKKLPKISERASTAFQTFADASFKAIGLTVPFMPSADFAWLLHTGNPHKFNKQAARTLLLCYSFTVR